MSERLIQTKVTPPRPPQDQRPYLVARPRLFHKLDRGLFSRLTLVSAPAGFGKTTLTANWLATHPDLHVAWVALDADDNDPYRFFRYLTAAHAHIPGFGSGLDGLLHAPQAPAPRLVAATWLSDVAEVDGDLVLVLDDVHFIETAVIHDALSYALDYLPDHVHLILISRSDPPLPLPRLRARRQLTELRTADLRFTAVEAAAFLNDVMGLPLDADAAAVLETRTEGWIAGLQMAALTMQGSDPAAQLAAFSGSNRFVFDYLADEVMGSLPPATQRFLLDTAVLQRLSAPLCNAVTGLDNGREMLLTLERANLFITALDPDRRWFRYHALFAEFLRQRLHETRPDDMARLRLRAADWFADDGQLDEAVDLYLAAGALDTAVALIVPHGRDMLMRGEGPRLKRWLDRLPDDTLRANPELISLLVSYHYVAGVSSALFPEIGVWLEQAEALVRAGDGIAPDRQESLLGEILAHQGLMAMGSSTCDAAIARFFQALEYADGQPYLQSYVNLGLGACFRATGSTLKALHHLQTATAAARKADSFFLGLMALTVRAEIAEVDGRLADAAALYAEALRLGSDPSGRPLPVAGMSLVGQAKVLRERNELTTAVDKLQQALELGRLGDIVSIVVDGLFTLALTRRGQGDFPAAVAALDEVESVLHSADEGSQDLRVLAFRTRIALAEGRADAAATWRAATRFSAADALDESVEIEHLTEARVLLAEERYADAVTLLTRLLSATQAAGRRARSCEARLLLALTGQQRGDTAAALDHLTAALALGAEGGYLRTFLDEGTAVARLIERVDEAELASTVGVFIARLQDAFTRELGAAGPVTAAGLLDPLKPREMQILRLIAAGRSNKEIAAVLFLTVGTVKVYTHELYSKLGVRRRTQAVERARELGLL